MEKTLIIAAGLCFILAPVISAFALTPQQVLELKKAGVSDQTIQMMIQQEEAAKNSPATMGVKELKDKDGNTVILYTTGESGNTADDDEEKKNVDRAWKMLNNIIIDKRNKK
jgi:long-subunit fatty acid transport protein